jgi:hypothetical protein
MPLGMLPIETSLLMLKYLCFMMTILHVSQMQTQKEPLDSLRKIVKNEYKFLKISSRDLLACFMV